METARSLQLYVRAIRSMDAVHRAGGKGRSVLALSRVVQYLVEHAIDHPRQHLSLVAMKEEDVPYDVQHPVNRAILAIALGHRIGLNRSALLDLGLCGLIIDMGMLSVPMEIREKPGKLTAAERNALELHPLASARYVLSSGRLDISARRRLMSAFEHHLGFDLGGYPGVLRWETLHLFSRILAVCEVYDALTTTTTWRMAALPDEALSTLVEMAGKQLDPALVSAMVNMLGRYPLGSTLALSTGEIAVVYLNHPDPKDQIRPVVRVVVDTRGEAVYGSVIYDLRERDASGGFVRSALRMVKPDELGVDVTRTLFS